MSPSACTVVRCSLLQKHATADKNGDEPRSTTASFKASWRAISTPSAETMRQRSRRRSETGHRLRDIKDRTVSPTVVASESNGARKPSEPLENAMTGGGRPRWKSVLAYSKRPSPPSVETKSGSPWAVSWCHSVAFIWRAFKRSTSLSKSGWASSTSHFSAASFAQSSQAASISAESACRFASTKTLRGRRRHTTRCCDVATQRVDESPGTSHSSSAVSSWLRENTHARSSSTSLVTWVERSRDRAE
mmetsp:Transcript_14632/g.49070  ORF Transcript_14632/g.49070 Transcript_14632/m.49070 type:complete len:247 (+) Transcript_14632:402-1142(+)